MIKSFIDSGADVDKIAYLHDDSFFTGVSFGSGVDETQLFASATIVNPPDKGRESWHLGYKDTGLSGVESLVMSRYWMFRSVYWHRVNRAIMAMLLHVIKKLYVDNACNVSSFIEKTMWCSEETVLSFLNEEYKKIYGQDSIIQSIRRSPKSIYQRLITIQGYTADSQENRLYKNLASLKSPQSSQQLEEWRVNLSKIFEDYLKNRHGMSITIKEDDILFDIPTRNIEELGSIYIEFDEGKVLDFERVESRSAKPSRDFERLANRYRVFVQPQIFGSIGAGFVAKYRRELMELVEQALPNNLHFEDHVR